MWLNGTMVQYWQRGLWAALGVLVFVGCGSGDARTGPPLHRISGVVKWNGQPLVGADVTFNLKDGSGSSFGRTDAAGRYELTTRASNDGAPAGDYLVTFSKVDEPAPSATNYVSQDDPKYNPYAGKAAAAQPPPKSTLPAKYADAKTSGITARVGEGSNPLDFDLK